MKLFKKLVAIFLALITCFAVTACFDKNKDSGGKNPDGYDPFHDYGADGGAYVVKDDEVVEEISIFKNDWAAFNDARRQNSPVYSALKSVIGVDVIAMNSSSNWQQQLGLMQTNEELPDIFLTEGPEDSTFFKRLIDNGDIIAISDWVNETTYPNIYKHMQQFSYMRSNIEYANGKSWFIPSSWGNEKSLFVRKDWINNLNAKLDTILVAEKIVSSAAEITEDIRAQWAFKEPADLLEFYRLARAFTLYDPDNNGLNDTTGYVSEANTDMDAWIFNAFEAGWGQFIKAEDGSYTYSNIAKGSLYATAFITRLMANGYMSKDSLTLDNGGKQSRFMQGNVGMMYAHNWLNQFVSGLMNTYKCNITTATNMIVMCDPPAGPNGAWNGAGSEGYWQGFCINANMSNARIRKCLDVYDYLLSDEGYELLQYGVEGVHYSVVDGEKVSLLADDAEGFKLHIQSEDPATMLYALVDWTMHYRSTVQTNADIIVPRQIRSEAHSLLSDYPALYTRSAVRGLSDCQSLFDETVANIKKNENNKYFTADDASTYSPATLTWQDLMTVPTLMNMEWNKMVKNWLESYSGQDILDEFNDYVNSGKAAKKN